MRQSFRCRQKPALESFAWFLQPGRPKPAAAGASAAALGHNGKPVPLSAPAAPNKGNVPRTFDMIDTDYSNAIDPKEIVMAAKAMVRGTHWTSLLRR